MEIWSSYVLLNRAKSIYSTCELYLQERNKLRVIFQKIGCPNLFINDTIKIFEDFKVNTKEKKRCEKDFEFTIGFTIF